jgi:prophage regulatory protein
VIAAAHAGQKVPYFVNMQGRSSSATFGSAETNRMDRAMRYLHFGELRAKLGGRARSSIYLDVQAGRLPAPIKLGGRLYWCEPEVDARLRDLATAQLELPLERSDADDAEQH